MSRSAIARQYLKHLEDGDMEAVIALFSETGTVASPLYGNKLASEFYRLLQNDTNASKLKLKGIYDNNDTNTLALHFNYHWTLKTAKEVNFDVVDIIAFDDTLKIKHLQIIYDTVVSRNLIS
ncbi:nuclear transport factor 2 family protein [uncultured Psychroserpens sp.]|uniref:nuclear transport factor 2 family protein n=1 Tax=uncultured Psychroserpens sp. TaxID=255436 RepID=UPI002621FA8D|nr:nuclear transport factor 2 family protein [uncultured Psychroserpens sp.]